MFLEVSRKGTVILAGIFISYRRDDSAGYAGRLYDRLSDHFGPDQVFMDVDTIKPGQNFVDAVRQAVGGCDGLVAIIGREWLTISDATGARRLDDPEDIVSLEIATALERGIRVIPVLVQGAPMPAATDFPESIKELSYRNAQEISDRSFNSDAQSLIEALEAPEPELPGSNDFVGRQPEMAELRAALDAAMTGRGQMVMLAGEPGIGKTRLAQELASSAQLLGAQVMWGWCYEHAGAPPYWPYVHPIRTYVETADAGQLSSQMGSGGAAIAEIVPELRNRLPDLGQPTAAEPEQARFRLFDSVVTFLKNLAQGQPLLFVVDDLHWADSSSLLMLEFLVREIATSPVLVLGTYRDVEVTASHPLSQTLGNLVRERHYRRVQLGGLTQHEIGEFVEASTGVVLPDDALETIHSRTDGNPLFVNEVVGLIDPEQMTEDRAWADIIPEGIRDAIGSRLSRLSESCNSVLATASVIGREFDFSLLRTLDSKLSPDAVLSALDEALQARVIEDVPEAVGRYQFGHALIQQALYDEMSSIRKLRAHASIAEALELLYGADAEAHAAELAYQFDEAQTVLGTEKLVRFSLLAGDRALGAYANEDASSHFQAALAGTEGRSMDAETAAIMFGLGRAQMAIGRTHYMEAIGYLDRAFDYYAETGDVERAVAVANHPTPTLGSYHTGTRQRIARALTMISPDSIEAGRLLALYGTSLGAEEGDYQAAIDAFARGLSIARKEGDLALELRTLAGALFVDFYHLRWRECQEKIPRCLELLKSGDDQFSEVQVHQSAGVAEFALGNLEAARRHLNTGLIVAEKLRDDHFVNNFLLRTDYTFRLEGHWQAAREIGERVFSKAPTEPRFLGTRGLLEYQVGDFDQGESYVARLLEAIRPIEPSSNVEYAAVAGLLPMIGWIKGEPYHQEMAKTAAAAVLSSNTVTPIFSAFARVGLTMRAVEEGDAALATEQYGALEYLRGSILPHLLTSVDRILGLLSQTMGNSNQAAIHFEDAMAFCRKAGYRPELAWTCCDYADLLRERDDHEYRPRATALLTESLTISTELGMKPLMDRAQSRLEILKA